MKEVILTISEVRETPRSKPKVVLTIDWTGSDKNSDVFKIASKAIDLIDTERRKL